MVQTLQIENTNTYSIQSLPCSFCIDSTGSRDSHRSMRSILVPSTHTGTSLLARKQEVPPGTAPASPCHRTRGGLLLVRSKQMSRLVTSLKPPWPRRQRSLQPPVAGALPLLSSPAQNASQPALFPPILLKLRGTARNRRPAQADKRA